MKHSDIHHSNPKCLTFSHSEILNTISIHLPVCFLLLLPVASKAVQFISSPSLFIETMSLSFLWLLYAVICLILLPLLLLDCLAADPDDLKSMPSSCDDPQPIAYKNFGILSNNEFL